MVKIMIKTFLILGTLLSSLATNASAIVVAGSHFSLQYTASPGYTSFGAPTIVGDSVLFFPTDFKAISVMPGVQIKPATITFTVIPNAGYHFNNLLLQESGDYVAVGSAMVAAGGQLRVKSLTPLLPTNIVPITPVTPFVTQSSFDLTNWDATASVNLSPTDLIQVTIENVLFATSSTLGSYSFIEKKEVVLTIGSTFITPPPAIPEPGTIGLMLLGLIGLVVISKTDQIS